VNISETGDGSKIVVCPIFLRFFFFGLWGHVAWLLPRIVIVPPRTLDNPRSPRVPGRTAPFKRGFRFDLACHVNGDGHALFRAAGYFGEVFDGFSRPKAITTILGALVTIEIDAVHAAKYMVSDNYAIPSSGRGPPRFQTETALTAHDCGHLARTHSVIFGFCNTRGVAALVRFIQIDGNH
jgi:hypothetical protein